MPMPPAPMGLLFVINDSPAAMEEELNAWYDTDHIPERLAIPGFLTASRHVSAERQRRYLALYDLTEVGVLSSAAYLAFSGENFTPWTRRVVTRTRVQRHTAVQAYPGDARTMSAPAHLVLRLRGLEGGALEELIARARSAFEGQPGVRQVRVFAGSDADAGLALVVVAGAGPLASLFAPQAFEDIGTGADLVETYLPY